MRASRTSAEPIRLVCFDVDGTLVDQTIYIWQTLHDHFGCDAEKRKSAADAFDARHISYAEWFAHDIELLRRRGATRESILTVIDRLRPAAGAHELLETLHQRGYVLAVISGSLQCVVDRFFPEVPFADCLINRFHFAPDGELIGGEPTAYDVGGKADGLREIARRHGLTVDQCAFVGDNKNDLDVMALAGLSIGVHVKHPSVRDHVHAVIADDDLRALLPFFP